VYMRMIRPRRRTHAARVEPFEALVRPHLERLHRLAYRFTGDPHAAEDLVQTLLLRMLPRTDALLRLEKPGPWLARALFNLFVDQVRSRGRTALDMTHGDSEAALQAEPADPADGPDALTARMLTREHLQWAVAQLPADQRALVAWHDIEGYTLQELSESHGVPLGTLKSRLHRARARLRQILTEPSGPDLRVKQ
jgi:RNA polymerase sigma-70 factor, ECF subfamily